MMRVIGLKSNNFKGIKAVDITPPEDIVQVSGANAAGKSSVIDSIWAALGKTKEIKQVIHEGEKEAEVQVLVGDDMPELRIKRVWAEGKRPRFEVIGKDGGKYSNPQKVIDGFMNKFTFDPLEFSRMHENDQVRTLMQLIGAEERLDELEELRKEAYDTRTLINRQIKQLQGELQGLPLGDPTVPDEPISITKLSKERGTAQAKAFRKQQLSDEIERQKQSIIDSNAQIQLWKRQIEAEEDRITQLKKRIADNITENEAIEEPDLERLDRKIADAEQINIWIAENRKREELESKIRDVQDQSATFSMKIKGIDVEKETIISNAALPLQGLGFNETGVTYHGRPLSDCSGMEKLEISAAIGMSLGQPEGINVMRISDGSSIDSKHLEKLRQMCQDMNFQMWIETVDETGEVGFYIEDGEVMEDNYHE